MTKEEFIKNAEAGKYSSFKGLDEMHVQNVILERVYDDIVGAKESGEISDGYHTFNELYEHRNWLFIQMCEWIREAGYGCWKSKKHSDGSEIEGWFIAGYGTKAGEQITYHLPMRLWDSCDSFVFEELEKAPEWDGHTPNDVLIRLKNL